MKPSRERSRLVSTGVSDQQHSNWLISNMYKMKGLVTCKAAVALLATGWHWRASVELGRTWVSTSCAAGSSCAEAQRKLQQVGSQHGGLPSLGSPKHPRLAMVSWDGSADGQHLGEMPQSCCKLLYTSCPTHTMRVYSKKEPFSHADAWPGLFNDRL